MPVSRGRRPKRAAKSGHRSGRPGRSQPDVAASLMKVLATLEDPLDAELLVSDAFGMAYEAARDDHGIVDGLANLLLAAAETADQPGAVEMLAALRTVAPETVAESARTLLAARLAARPELPRQPWVGTLEPARCTRALAMQDAFADTTEYLVAFSRGGSAHALLWLVDNNVVGGLARDVLVAGDAEEVERQLRDLAAGEDLIPVTITEVDPAVLHGRLRAATDRETLAETSAQAESYARTRMLAYARLRSLPDAVPSDPPRNVDDAERERIVAEFLASPERSQYPKELDEASEIGRLVRLIVDHAADVVGGSPYRITPSTVELFLLDWVPGNATLDEHEEELLPVVMEWWAAYALRIEPLGPVDVVLDAIAEVAGEFDHLVGRQEGG